MCSVPALGIPLLKKNSIRDALPAMEYSILR